jgi:hypothetical protein
MYWGSRSSSCGGFCLLQVADARAPTGAIGLKIDMTRWVVASLAGAPSRSLGYISITGTDSRLTRLPHVTPATSSHF